METAVHLRKLNKTIFNIAKHRQIKLLDYVPDVIKSKLGLTNNEEG